MEICSVCRKEVHGGFEVRQWMRTSGVPVIVIDSTADRDFNVCDLCNVTICFNCSKDPDSGYCNECLREI